MLKGIFMLLKPRLNTFGCVYEQTVIPKNCVIVRKHLDQRMPLVTKNVHIVTGSNLTSVIIGPAEYQDIAA
jgi:hypothetical protein